MFFIKYAPVHYRRLLTSIYLLFWLAVILMWSDSRQNFIINYGVDEVLATLVLLGGYFGINFILAYGFKPVVEKNNKSYITPYIIDLLLLIVLFILNADHLY
tara:strand:- start:683 stop:988 length:306 start_codon:yes stop_codon:yes gene_type:complete